MLWDSDLVVLVSGLQFVLLVSENLLEMFHSFLTMKLNCKTFYCSVFLQALKGCTTPYSALTGFRHVSFFLYSVFFFKHLQLLLFFKKHCIFMMHVLLLLLLLLFIANNSPGSNLFQL